jgi:hypothetical protein
VPCVNAAAAFVANSENANWPVRIIFSTTNVNHYFQTGLPANCMPHLRKKPAPVTACQTPANHVGAWRHPNKINVSIEAGSTLGNNAPAVLYQQRNFG